jgi:heat shock protein HspQ
MDIKTAQFTIGQVVRHSEQSIRGFILVVDAEYSSTEYLWQSVPQEARPARDQPFYRLLAEDDSVAYLAYVSEQNLQIDESGEPLQNPQVAEMFGEFLGDSYAKPNRYLN